MNGKSYLSLSFFISILFLFSCVKVDIPQNPSTDPGEEMEEVEELVDWTLLEANSERKIQNTLGTPFEFYAITENQFFRFARDLELIEKRPLDASNSLYGRPILHDNTFVRLSQNEDNRQVVEFHLTRSPLEIREFVVSELRGEEDDFIEVDFRAVYPGAFSDDGVYFMLPVKSYPNYHYTLFLFEVRHSPNHNEFTSIEVIDRIEVPGITVDVDNLENIRFIEGHFYLASKEGGFRVNVNGTVEKVLQPWIIDFFENEGRLYATGFNDFDFYKSSNNGRTWQKEEGNSKLKIVEAKGNYVFTQEIEGRPFQLAMSDLKEVEDIFYNEDFTDDPTSYVNMDFFNGKYFMSLHKEIYYVDDIQLK